jgi:signal peptidase I
MGPHVHGRQVEGDPARAASLGWRARADPLLAAVVFALFARTFLFQGFEVPSASMEKNVLTGDRLLVNKFVFAPGRGLLAAVLPERPIRRGDVLVFRYPEDPRRDFIKRVVALPGETVEIHDKRVSVDGRPLVEPYAFHADDAVWPDDPSVAETHRRRDQMSPRRVPDGAYFVLGDNRDDSGDSRYWGPVPAGNVLGRALFVYWSIRPRPSDAPSGFAALVRLPIEFARRTRWDRMFHPVR